MSAAPAQENTQLRPWVETFGDHLCGMSCVLGIPVEEVALCVSGVLTNVTGPLSGVGTKGGGGIAQGINLISVGELSHRSQRLAEHLFQPLYALQDFIRHSAHRTSRMWSELFLSGPDTLKAWKEALNARPTEVHSRLINMLSATVKDLQAGDTLPHGWDSAIEPLPDFDGTHHEVLLRERVPGLRLLPSFLLRPGSLSELLGMMTDVADQHAFILDPEGRLFEEANAEASKWGALVRNLALLMGGKDLPMPRRHADQGNGKLVRGRAALFSAMSPGRVAEFLGEAATASEQLVLEEAILWKASRTTVRPLPNGWNRWLWPHYKALLERLINDRAARKGTIVEHPQSLNERLDALDAEVVNFLDNTPDEFRRYMRPFGTLVGKLSWAFSLLGIGEKMMPVAIKATVTYASANHIALLKDALSQVEAQRAERFARQIQSVLKAKGPCSARTLQRSIFQSRRSDIDVGLERLVTAGRVVFLQAKREYHIPDDVAVANHSRI